jgi:hypothetical protein
MNESGSFLFLAQEGYQIKIMESTVPVMYAYSLCAAANYNGSMKSKSNGSGTLFFIVILRERKGPTSARPELNSAYASPNVKISLSCSVHR